MKNNMKKKMGRPKAQIKWEEFEKLCSIQCTLTEIASWFKCSESTIVRRCKEEKGTTFEGYYKKHSVAGRISLRRSQFKVANDGNPTLLIWLGKQYLNQKDRQEEKNSTTKPQPIKVEIITQDARRTENKD